MKTIKKPVGSDAIRKSYYRTADGLGGLTTAIQNDPATKGDAKLKASLKMLRDAEKALAAALAPYAWD